MRPAIAICVLACASACSPTPHAEVRVEDPTGRAAPSERLEVVNELTAAARRIDLEGRSLPATFVLTGSEGPIHFVLNALRADGALLARGRGEGTLSPHGGRIVVTLIPVCASAASCDDGDPCNGEERCEAGTCAPGEAKLADDGDPCTHEACTQAGLAHVRDATTDGTACGAGSEAGTCQQGWCIPFDCSVTDSCPAECGNGAVEDGEGCDDGDQDPCDGCDACQVIAEYSCAHPECAPPSCGRGVLTHAEAQALEVRVLDVTVTSGVPFFAVVERHPGGSDPVSTVRLMRAPAVGTTLSSVFSVTVSDRVSPPLDAAIASASGNTMLAFENGNQIGVLLRANNTVTVHPTITTAAPGDVGLGAAASQFVVMWRNDGAVERPKYAWRESSGIDGSPNRTLADHDSVGVDVSSNAEGSATFVWVNADTTAPWFAVHTNLGLELGSAALDVTGGATAPRAATAADGIALAVWLRDGRLRGRVVASPFDWSDLEPLDLGPGVAADVFVLDREWAVVYLDDGTLWMRTVSSAGAISQARPVVTGPLNGSALSGPIASASDGSLAVIAYNNVARDMVAAVVFSVSGVP